jgi:hypothetical protein
MHRVNWDLRYNAPPALTHSFEINANPGQTPASPEGALVPPGVYTVSLTVNGKAHAAKVVVTSDPRSPANLAALRAEDALIKKLDASERLAWDAFRQVDTMRAQLRAMTANDSTSDIAKTIRAHRQLDRWAGAAVFWHGGANAPTSCSWSVGLNQLGADTGTSPRRRMLRHTRRRATTSGSRSLRGAHSTARISAH